MTLHALLAICKENFEILRIVISSEVHDLCSYIPIHLLRTSPYSRKEALKIPKFLTFNFVYNTLIALLQFHIVQSNDSIGMYHLVLL